MLWEVVPVLTKPIKGKWVQPPRGSAHHSCWYSCSSWKLCHPTSTHNSWQKGKCARASAARVYSLACYHKPLRKVLEYELACLEEDGDSVTQALWHPLTKPPQARRQGAVAEQFNWAESILRGSHAPGVTSLPWQGGGFGGACSPQTPPPFHTATLSPFQHFLHSIYPYMWKGAWRGECPCIKKQGSCWTQCVEAQPAVPASQRCHGGVALLPAPLRPLPPFSASPHWVPSLSLLINTCWLGNEHQTAI